MIYTNQKFLFIAIVFFLFFNKSVAQELKNEYLLKLPDSYFKENISKTISDKIYNQQYFETKENLHLIQIFGNERNELQKWLLVKSEKKLDLKFDEIKNIGKILHFQNNNILRIKSIPNDSLYHKQWYHRKVESAKSWQNFTPQERIILTVIDTGIDYNHPDLINSLWSNSSEDLNGNGVLDSLDLNNVDDDGNGYIDDVIGWDFTDAPRFPDGGDYLDPDNDPMDEYQNGHGTQITGIIAAEANNSIGIVGVTPEISVMNLRAGTASGYLEEDDVAAAIIYAIENGSRVINMSFGDVVVSAFLKDVIQYAHSQDAVLVASSGNSGTNELHFPSGFAETISVGASDSLDALASFSSWGQTLDLTAPGQDILSTKIGGEYNYSNGTSFSAPMVSAAAAFVLSNNPNFSNEQVRNILKSSTDDLGSSGWDVYYGSGRLNLYRASLVNYESELIIESPASGSYTALNIIPIIATIQDADLQNASLLIGEGKNPSNWIEIFSNFQNQVISDTIASLNLSIYSDTTLVLRLLAETWQGQVKEYRSVLNVDKSNPEISNMEKLTMFDGNHSAMLISFQTDDVTRGDVRLRQKSSTLPYFVKNLKYETQNHKILIGSEEISGDVEFEIFVENLAGLETTEGGSSRYEFSLSSEIIPDLNFTKLNYSLPKGYLLPKTTDFDADGNEEIVLSLYDENNSFGNVCVYEFENNQFNKRAETSFPAIPRDYGDSDGDGKKELLLGFGRTSYLFESFTINGFPDTEVWKDTSDFWVSRICDLDNDGYNEILGKSGTDYRLLETTGDNSYTEKFTFTNPTNGENALGPPSAIISDFENDSYPDLVFGDYDGDFVVYENNGNDNFVNRFSDNLPLIDATDFVTAGYFLDSNNSSFMIGTHTDESTNLESEFDARFWSYFHYGSESDNNYTKIQRINIFGYADVREFDSGISTGEDNNQTTDYVILSAFPDLYIFQSNGDSLVPKWYYNEIQSNKVVVHDYNNNGAVEIYFNNGDSIVVYEIGESNSPLPPSNVQAIPLDTNSVQISWDAVVGAQRYIIWRGLTESSLIQFDSISTTTFFEDLGLIKDSTYFYALQTYDNTFISPYSSLSTIQSAKPNEPPLVDTVVVVNNNQVQIFFNEKMLKSSLEAINFRIMPHKKYATSALPVHNAKGVLLTFPVQFRSDSVNTINMSDIRDTDKTLLDSIDHAVRFYSENIEKAPYIKEWEMPNRFKLIVNYNLPMDSQSILNLDNYTLEPSGEIVDVQSLDNYDMSYEMTLSLDSYAGAIGIPTYINFNDIYSSSGELFDKGNRFSLTKSAENLKNIIIYPQPAGKNSNTVTFANITPNTIIKVFDINGKLVVDLKEENSDGGVQWDMKNDKGERVAAGIYIFYATNQKETKTGKIAIVR